MKNFFGRQVLKSTLRLIELFQISGCVYLKLAPGLLMTLFNLSNYCGYFVLFFMKKYKYGVLNQEWTSTP